jgi:Protein kinase domain
MKIDEACRLWPKALKEMALELRGLKLEQVQNEDDFRRELDRFELDQFCQLFVLQVAKPIRVVIASLEKELKTLAGSVKKFKQDFSSKHLHLHALIASRKNTLQHVRPLFTLLQSISMPIASSSGSTSAVDFSDALLMVQQRDSVNESADSQQQQQQQKQQPVIGSPERSQFSSATKKTYSDDGSGARDLSPPPFSSSLSSSPRVRVRNRAAKSSSGGGDGGNAMASSSTALALSLAAPRSGSASAASSSTALSGSATARFYRTTEPPSSFPSHSSGTLSSSSSAKPGSFAVTWRDLFKSKKASSSSSSSSSSATPSSGSGDEMGQVDVVKELSKIGGSGCSVYLVSVEGWLCALKQIDLAALSDDFRREISILEQLPHHQNVVRYLGHDYTDTECRLFVELWDGTLGAHMNRMRERNVIFTPVQATRIALDIASGLAFLHQHHIVHRDLKSDVCFSLSLSLSLSLACSLVRLFFTNSRILLSLEHICSTIIAFAN